MGPVAQWSEPAAHNGLVGGSSPSRPTKLAHEWIDRQLTSDENPNELQPDPAGAWRL